MPLPHHEMGRWSSTTPTGVDEGGVVGAQVQRTGDGFLVHHEQGTTDLMCA
jgi:hypothetical protein